MQLLFAGTPVASLPKIPFFENMWATAATTQFSATQIWAKDAMEWESPQDFASVLGDMDHYCSASGTSLSKGGSLNAPGCGIHVAART